MAVLKATYGFYKELFVLQGEKQREKLAQWSKDLLELLR